MTLRRKSHVVLLAAVADSQLFLSTEFRHCRHICLHCREVYTRASLQETYAVQNSRFHPRCIKVANSTKRRRTSDRCRHLANLMKHTPRLCFRPVRSNGPIMWKTWRHPQNRKYITYCIVDWGWTEPWPLLTCRPTEMLVKFGRNAVFDVCERTDRQTNRQTYRYAYRNTSHPYRGEVKYIWQSAISSQTRFTVDTDNFHPRMCSITFRLRLTVFIVRSLTLHRFPIQPRSSIIVSNVKMKTAYQAALCKMN